MCVGAYILDACSYSYIYIYIYNSFLLPVVVSHMCISLYLGHICPDEVYDHTKPSKVVYRLSMHAYIEYVVILIIYTIVVVF